MKKCEFGGNFGEGKLEKGKRIKWFIWGILGKKILYLKRWVQNCFYFFLRFD